MKYFIDTEDGDRIEVELEPLDDGAFELTLDGTTCRVDFRRVGPRTGSVLIDGRSHLLTFEENNGNLVVSDGAGRIPVRVRDERELVLDGLLGRRPEGTHAGVVKSPMPGKIVEVLIAEGDRVEVDQPLLIMEAMKMENEVRSALAGIARKVHVQVGQTVSAGDPLLEIGGCEA